MPHHDLRQRTRRDLLVRVHRCAGLATALFLTVAGLTGSVIAFNHELDGWLNPSLFRAPAATPRLTPLEIADKVERHDPRVRVSYLPLRIEPGRAADLFVEPVVDPATGRPFAVEYNEIFVDPTTGEILGTRLWGACCFARERLIPFLYSLHYSLHLPENVGLWVMGLIAMVWTVDSFVGLYLTLPRRGPFLRRWRKAWILKSSGNAYRLNFDLHRAGGLWAWALILVMGVSAVSLALGDQIMRPLVSLVSPLSPDTFHEREDALGGQLRDPAVGRAWIVASAEREAKRRGWDEPLDGVFYASTAGLYGVAVGDHHAAGLGSPYLYFDGASGRLVGADIPGTGSAGDRFLQLQFPLHSGQIAGLPGRILISALGLVVAMLSITGVIIWARKRWRRGNRGTAAEPHAPTRAALSLRTD